MRYRMRDGIIPTEGPRSTSWRSTASIPLIAEGTSVSRRSSSTDAILRKPIIENDLYLHNILWTDEACDTREGVLTSTTVTSGHGLILMLSETMDIKSTSALAFGLEWSGRLSWAPICSATSWFYDNCSSGLFEDVPLAMRQSLWFQHDGAQAHREDDIQQLLNATYTGMWTGRRGQSAWPPRSPYLTSTDFFL
jgi:hypothetical protein